MSSEFRDRVALITGGSRGIGQATARRLATEGAHVAVTYASRATEAEKTCAEIMALGRKALAVRCQVEDERSVQDAVAATRSTLGPIDYVAHCGAISNLASHTELSSALWREMIDVNLTGAYHVIFAVKDEMIRRGFGRIVILSSIAALLPRKMQIHYASAKAGVLALTRCCAEAFAPHNVRVNAITPGLIETEMAHVLPEERIREVVAATPLGRIGRPEEIAGLIRFLCSEDSSFMTGETVSASGGRFMLG